MSSPDSISFTFVCDDGSEVPSTQDFRNALQKGTDEVKCDTIKKIIVATLNGSPQPQLLMPIIQFCMPSRSKALKKLLHTYWEVCPKHDDNGKLKQEMILVVNAIRNDLQHPNEYIRGATLRSVQKLKEPELLEPLLPICRSCLEHRHSYVRKNAVFAIYSIFKDFEHLIPDGPELMQTFLAAETDMTCKRNAFVFLANCAMPRAVEYLMSVLEQIPSLDELMQMAIIETIRKDCQNESPKYIRCIFELLNASSHSVKYEAATTLTSLTQNPAAVKAAATCFVELVAKESDNNVKLIVLDRLETLRSRHDHVIDSLVMDLLQVLTAPDMEVRRKCLNIALSMVNSRNVEDVVGTLKKQLVKTLDGDYEKNLEYRQLLIQSIHICSIRFSEVAASVVHALMEFLGDSNNPSAVDVISFVREVVEKFPNLRASIVEKLLDTFGDIKSGKVFRGALWIAGEYCADPSDIQEAMQAIRKVVGEIPILTAEQRLAEDGPSVDEAGEKKDGATKHAPRVLADGTYATESAYTTKADVVKSANKPPLRALLLGGDFYTGAVLSSTLAKLILRLAQTSKDVKKVNTLRAEAMLIMTSIIRVGQSKYTTVPIDEDSQERVMNCISTLSELNVHDVSSKKQVVVNDMFLKDTKAAYAKMVATEEKKAAEKREKENKSVSVQVDDLLTFRQFSKKAASDGIDAYVKMHGFDILLDVLVVNQTATTMQNLCLEFATLGDLKLVERPATHTLAAHSFHSIKATIKVSSTETGVIFGNIIWESGTSETCVVLSDIHIDIMDYIKPAHCNESQFRSMWTEFEWENRVNVTTTITDLRAYLSHIMSSTNMSCLTPEAALSGDCDFLSANLYARSSFGEDALANLSIEKMVDTGSIQGHVRIRSKTQGIALSLGDKITLAQKEIAATA
ncbi:coatomer subunit beta [Tulasnella sp. 330]|nr:coatomer subunit beta [Tulasnella sp. 330]